MCGGNDEGAQNAKPQVPHLPPSQLLPAEEGPAGENERGGAHEKEAVGEAGGVDAVDLPKMEKMGEMGEEVGVRDEGESGSWHWKHSEMEEMGGMGDEEGVREGRGGRGVHP